MRSTAHFKAHPLHPALIPFPFGLLLAALLFDLAGLIFGRAAFHQTAAHLTLAGLATGVLAAVPGVIDYLYAVPPGSSGQVRARKHGAANAVALVLFGAAWWTREPDTVSLLTLASEALGGAALAYAGALGGTLVTRNMISVDHRYAGAGKWQEQTITARTEGRVDLGSSSTLQDDQMRLLRINGHRIVLARTRGGYTAFSDRCTHRGGSLAGGVCVAGTVQCLWHGSQFDCRTGQVRIGPAREGITVYEVKEEQGRLFLLSPPA